MPLFSSSVGAGRVAPAAAVVLRAFPSTMCRSLDSSASVFVGSARSAPLLGTPSDSLFTALGTGAPPSLPPSVGTAWAAANRSFSLKSFSTSSWTRAQKSPEVFKALKEREALVASSLPAALRHPLRGVTTESFTDKVYRWLDVAGFLTRWTNRKEWVLDLIPLNRVGSSTITEFERKQEMFVTLNAQILALITMYLAYTGIQHVHVKPPNPSYEGFPGVDGRKKDFTITNRLFFMEPKERCKECRWLDLECKKECFATLKAEGYKLFVNNGDPLSIPRSKLEPPHFH